MVLFFDIGANIGAWAHTNLNQSDQIVAVEADPDTYAILVKNIRNEKIKCLNYAVCIVNCQKSSMFR